MFFICNSFILQIYVGERRASVKKSVAVIALVVMLFICTSCSNEYKTPYTDNNKFEITAEMLSDYSIVYPDTYNKYRMEDVYCLRTAVEQFCKSDINVVSDSVDCEGKKIILASSAETYFCKEKVISFYGTLNYLIAVDEETHNIILGGANYYADMLAINDFCDNYLTENSEQKISGIKESKTSKNIVSVTACMLTASPFLEYSCFSDMVKVGFNTVLVDASMYTEYQIHELLKWCAADNVDILMRNVVYTDIYFDSPNVKGHLIVDEPYGKDAYAYYTEECKNYLETYGFLLWKPYINIIAQKNVISALKWSKIWFDCVEKVSFKIDVDSIVEIVELCSEIADYAAEQNKKITAGINVDMSVEGYSQYDIMRLMSYIGLCFGTDGVEYFNYAGSEDCEYGTMVDKDFNKSDAWHYAVEINYETKNIGNVLKNYEYIGAFMFYDSNSVYMYGESVYNDMFTDNVEIVWQDGKARNFIVGALKNEATGKFAYTILNLSPADNNSELELRVSAYDTRIWIDGNVMNSDFTSSDVLKIVIDGTECVVVEVFSDN